MAADLHGMIENDDIEGLRAALEAGEIDIDAYRPCRQLETAINRHGLKGTPLHLAAATGNAAAVEALLDAGADRSLRVIQSERGDEMIPYATAGYLAGKMGLKEIEAILKKETT